MLMHHADAGPNGVPGPLEADRLAIDLDLARIGLDQAVENIHQCAFAGAVLADERVDLPGKDREVDAVIGQDAGELLYDATHFNGDLVHSAPGT